MLDATYRTTKYDVALFFLVVPTNVGFTVAAEFCVQSEGAAEIAEALEVSWKSVFVGFRYFLYISFLPTFSLLNAHLTGFFDLFLNYHVQSLNGYNISKSRKLH